MQKKEASEFANEGNDLYFRVSELEQAVASEKKEPASSFLLRWAEVLSKLLLPLLLFWLAFTFKDSVQLALEYQRLEVQSAEAIEKLLKTLHKKELESDEATAAALTLSAYGKVSVMSLVSVLEHGSPNAETAAKQGLFVLGLTHPDAVIESMTTVLSKRKRQFRWQTHQTAIDILGELALPEALHVLLDYKPSLVEKTSKGLAKWQRTVRGAEKGDYDSTRETLKTALAVYGENMETASTGGKK